MTLLIPIAVATAGRLAENPELQVTQVFWEEAQDPLWSLGAIVAVLFVWALVFVPIRQLRAERRQNDRLVQLVERRPSFSVECLGFGATPKENLPAFMEQKMITPGSTCYTVSNFRVTNRSDRKLQLFYRLLVFLKEGDWPALWLQGNWRDTTVIVDDSNTKIASLGLPAQFRDGYFSSPLELEGEQTVTGSLVVHRYICAPQGSQVRPWATTRT